MNKKLAFIFICITAILLMPNTATAQNSWQQITPTGDIPPARHGHTMVLIGNRVFLFGGKTTVKSSLDTLHLYSAALMEWTEEEPENSPPPPRFNHQAIVRNGKLYVFFGMGNNGVLDDIWEYDPETKLWRQIIPEGAIIPEARSEHSATVEDNTVYIVGGVDKNGNSLSDIWVYNFASNRWQQLQSIPGIRIHGHNAAVNNGNLLVYGGLVNGGMLTPEILKYTPGTNSWTTIMPDGDFYPTANAAAVEYLSKLFLFGGFSGFFEPLCFLWDLNSNTFTPLANGPALASAAAALAYKGNRVKNGDSEYVEFIVFGGGNDDAVFDNTWIYTTDIEISTGVNETSHQPVKFYPNPADKQIIIQTDEHSYVVELINIYGQVVLKEHNVREIDVTTFARGTYILKLTTGEGVREERVILN